MKGLALYCYYYTETTTMTFDDLENVGTEQESIHIADGAPHSGAKNLFTDKHPAGFENSASHNRIPAHELFSLFTASIITENVPFIR